MIKNQYELEQEAKSIAIAAQEDHKANGTDVWDYMHEVCDGHPCVIWTYKAGMMCLECDRDNAEYQLDEIGYEAKDYSQYVSALAYAILFDACTTAHDELTAGDREEEEEPKEVTTERTVLLTGKERDDYIASHWGMKK